MIIFYTVCKLSSCATYPPVTSHDRLMAFSLDPETKIQATAILLECTEQSSRRLKLLQQYWQQQEKKKKRSAWVKPWLTRRKHQGHYDNLMKELREQLRAGSGCSKCGGGEGSGHGTAPARLHYADRPGQMTVTPRRSRKF